MKLSYQVPRVSSESPNRRLLDWSVVFIEGGLGRAYLYWNDLMVTLEAVKSTQSDTLISLTLDVEDESPSMTFMAGMSMPMAGRLESSDLIPLVPKIQQAIDHFLLPFEIVEQLFPTAGQLASHGTDAADMPFGE